MVPSPSVRRFAVRLRLYRSITRIVRGLDASDALSFLALGLIGVGVSVAAWGAVVVGALLLTVTPIGTALRVFVRGR